MSTTSVRAGSRPRVAPTNDANASSLPVSTCGRTPRIDSTAAAKSSAFSASRAAEVAQNRTRLDAQHRDQLGILAGGLQRAVDRLVGQPSGRVDALAETHDAHLADELGLRVPSVMSAMSRRIELVPQSIAATRSRRGMS